MKKLILAVLLLLSIGVMTVVDLNVIRQAPYPSLSQEQIK
ncbi:hypothetical protein N644_1598 [Lactiplantibacillus paraplantarum]|uniref:Uncharacterized protein n=1 Tax=Lactiplantibacillus paraplantarum TaxID=60520 RepID=A0A2I9DM03_9LACO|nr:hypothetical protein DA077_05775 [Lactiplantibacillus paraplantarum]AYJ38319.1 hypothetical protein LP667_05600 [Lactiplantibacillus paraplantarum]ERL44313.1 hypothetical protein N644_1598 [Lactiplantibacillus paraplantarum]MCT4458264.1 hypothetical protein [Lactiplantibacillus paraplantarum]RDG11072.1 hypothetical protein DQM08_10245 [Lactiplantibacillus paraplantarum]